MNIFQKAVRNIKAHMILREADKILRDYPELTYKQAFCKALEVYNMDNTPIYRRWSEGEE